MMKLAAALLGLVGTGLGQILSADEPGPAPTVPIGVSKAPFAKAVGRVFELDGKIGYFAGTNSWWLAHLSNDADVDLVFQQMVDTQYKITRVWGFGDVNTPPPATNTDPNKVWFQLLNSTGAYINYGADGIQRLDYVVSAAEKAGIRLVIPFVNNWGDYGGIAAYTTAFGGNATSWYTDAQSQATYRSYVKLLVDRYKASPAIFAWELGNEPRATGGNYTTTYDWAVATSAYIKSLDPHHMVTTGEEGFFDVSDGINDGEGVYSGGDGSSFSHNIRIPTIDYGTFHLYPNYWGRSYDWGNTWILEHDAIGEEVGKPVVFEEYGTPFPHNHTGTEAPWQQTTLESGVAADQIWQFGPNGTSVEPDWFGDVNTIYYLDDEYQSLGKQHAADMLAKKVVCKTKGTRRRRRGV